MYGMIFCENCGTDVFPLDNGDCPNCGEELPVDVDDYDWDDENNEGDEDWSDDDWDDEDFDDDDAD